MLKYILPLFLAFSVSAQTLVQPGRGGSSGTVVSPNGDTLAAMKTRPQAIFDVGFVNINAEMAQLSYYNRYINDGYYIPLAITSSRDNINALPLLEVINAFSWHRSIPIGNNNEVPYAVYANNANLNTLGAYISATYALFRTYPPYNASAKTLWRRALAGATSSSVDIILYNDFENFAQVYNSVADSISGSSGSILLNTKARRVVVSGIETGTANAITATIPATTVTTLNATTVPIHVVTDSLTTGANALNDSTARYASTNWLRSNLADPDPLRLGLIHNNDVLALNVSATATLDGYSLATPLYATFGTVFYGTNQFTSTQGTWTWTTSGATFVASGNGKDYNIRPAVTAINWAFIGTNVLGRFTMESGRIFKQGDDLDGDLSFRNGRTLKFRTTGSADTIGTATLVGGTVTVSTTAVKTGDIIYLTFASAGGTQGFLRVGTITANTSFVITSSSGTDTSTVNWMIVHNDIDN